MTMILLISMMMLMIMTILMMVSDTNLKAEGEEAWGGLGWRYCAWFHCIGVPGTVSGFHCIGVPLCHCIGVRGKKLQNDDSPHCVCTQIFVFSGLMTITMTMTARVMMIERDDH